MVTEITFKASPGIAVIPLSKGFSTIIDSEDFDRVNEFKWHYTKGYAAGSKYINTNKTLFFLLHRFILNIIDPKIKIDHINGNPLDNRKENLRICTQKQNSRNQRKQSRFTLSEYKGVTFSTEKWRQKRWQAQIQVDGKHIYLGRFSTEQEAASAYNIAAKKYFGEYSRLNNL